MNREIIKSLKTKKEEVQITLRNGRVYTGLFVWISRPNENEECIVEFKDILTDTYKVFFLSNLIDISLREDYSDNLQSKNINKPAAVNSQTAAGLIIKENFKGGASKWKF